MTSILTSLFIIGMLLCLWAAFSEPLWKEPTGFTKLACYVGPSLMFGTSFIFAIIYI